MRVITRRRKETFLIPVKISPIAGVIEFNDNRLIIVYVNSSQCSSEKDNASLM
jgi:hypothetical protein